MAEKCSNCRFFHQDLGSDLGQCRRHAPVLVPHTNWSATENPLVSPGYWCGDWESKFTGKVFFTDEELAEYKKIAGAP